MEYKPCHRVSFCHVLIAACRTFRTNSTSELLFEYGKTSKESTKRYFIETPGTANGDNHIPDSVGCAFPWTFARRS